MARHPRLRAAALAAALVAVLGTAPGAARAQDDEESLAYEGTVGVASALTTLVYSPLKIAYAAGGLAISALAFLWTFGNADAAGPIFTSSVGGDYVVTPAHLEGTRDLHFFGPE